LSQTSSVIALNYCTFYCHSKYSSQVPSENDHPSLGSLLGIFPFAKCVVLCCNKYRFLLLLLLLFFLNKHKTHDRETHIHREAKKSLISYHLNVTKNVMTQKPGYHVSAYDPLLLFSNEQNNLRVSTDMFMFSRLSLF
jgi:hypothetical protein